MQNFVSKLFCIALIAVAIPNAVLAADPSASEYAVKTAIVYKLTKFVNWPKSAFSSPQSSLNICVDQSGPFYEPMQSLQGRTVHGHNLEIVGLSGPGTPATNCHVLIISEVDKNPAVASIASAASQPVLTIGDTDGFADQGGMVGLELEQSRIVFAINVGASQQAGLDISVQLLQLARIVDTEGAES